MSKKLTDITMNVGITKCSEISEICKPLYDILDLTYFNYVKLNADGSRSTLTDRPEFLIAYYQDKQLFETKAVRKMENTKNTTCRLSSEFRDQHSYIVARNEFNIDNGLTIIQPNGTETELYYFGTTRDNYSKTSLYINNIDMFYRFIAYFKDKAEKLLIQADKEKFYLPIDENSVQHTKDETSSEIRRKFIEATQIDKYFVKDENSDVFLTKREAVCLYYMMFLKSAKEIGNVLNISVRTVEAHLIKVKEKLRCKTKKELQNKLTCTDLGRIISYLFMGTLSTDNKLLYPINLVQLSEDK